jgi:hypothetical protein
MQLRKLCFVVTVGAALAAPFGCGKDSEGDSDGATGGSAGTTAGGSLNRGGSAGRPATSGSGPTGCEGISPKTGEDCDDVGIVCPSELGSCVCQSRGRGWECFEVGGHEGGSANLPQGGAGPELGGASGSGMGMAGEGGAASGGEPSAGHNTGGAAAGAPTAGAGGEG